MPSLFVCSCLIIAIIVLSWILAFQPSSLRWTILGSWALRIFISLVFLSQYSIISGSSLQCPYLSRMCCLPGWFSMSSRSNFRKPRWGDFPSFELYFHIYSSTYRWYCLICEQWPSLSPISFAFFIGDSISMCYFGSWLWMCFSNTSISSNS